VVACPEALFSACLRGWVRGIDTQLTARGQTLAEFRVNFEAVHALFDPPEPRQTTSTPPESQGTGPSQGGPPVCPYHGPMKESTKVKGTWFCPAKMGDGSYCKEKHPKGA